MIAQLISFALLSQTPPSIPDRLEAVWTDHAASRNATSDHLMAVFEDVAGIGRANGTIVTLREEGRGSLWQRDIESPSGTRLRFQHDLDSDEWLVHRLDVSAVDALQSGVDAAAYLLRVRDRLVREQLIDSALFASCRPEVTPTFLGGGASIGPERPRLLVEVTARCRGTFQDVQIANLGIQVRLRSSGMSSLRFSRVSLRATDSALTVPRPEPVSQVGVRALWPKMSVKENAVVYLAEKKPAEGETYFRLVNMVAGAEVGGGSVSRVRVLVRPVSATLVETWRESFLGERQASGEQSQRGQHP